MALPITRLSQKISAEQRKVAEYIAANDYHQMTIEQMAEDVGVTPRTVYRWKNDANFIAYVNERAELAMEAAISETYIRLRGMIRSDNEKSVLKAIELILKNRGKLTDVTKQEVTLKDGRETSEIEAEVEALKKRLGI